MIWVVSPCYVLVREANRVNSKNTILGFEGMRDTTYCHPKCLVISTQFFFARCSPLSIGLSRFDGCHFTELPLGLVNIFHSSIDHLCDIIPVVCPVSLPCQPICLHTLLQSDLIR